MQVSVILAHPRTGSFNHAIADEAAAMLRKSGYTVVVNDLYQEEFDPLLPYDEIPRDTQLPPVIALHCREIAEADGIIFVYPDWGVCRLRSSKAGSTGSSARESLTGLLKQIPVKEFRSVSLW
jgi:hypothetical protein